MESRKKSRITVALGDDLGDEARDIRWFLRLLS
jgi:hypothetical protein